MTRLEFLWACIVLAKYVYILSVCAYYLWLGYDMLYFYYLHEPYTGKAAVKFIAWGMLPILNLGKPFAKALQHDTIYLTPRRSIKRRLKYLFTKF